MLLRYANSTATCGCRETAAPIRVFVLNFTVTVANVAGIPFRAASGEQVTLDTISKALRRCQYRTGRSKLRIGSPDPDYLVKRERVEELSCLLSRGNWHLNIAGWLPQNWRRWFWCLKREDGCSSMMKPIFIGVPTHTSLPAAQGSGKGRFTWKRPSPLSAG